MSASSLRERKSIDIFWAEIAACDHCVQIYDNDAVFLDALERFVAAGLAQGEAIILIATPPHLQRLSDRLSRSGFDLSAAAARDQYIAVDAETALASFMRDDWPEEDLFLNMVRTVLGRARRNFKTVRAFGEMVAILWALGNRSATIRLEHLWARLCRSDDFSLFCAYPRAGFTQDAEQSMMDVHLAHSLVYNEA